MGARKESKDLVEKHFEAFPDIAADIINALLYDGEPCVSAEHLLPAPTETLYQGRDRLRNQYQDLVKFEVLSGRLRMVYQFANQSTVDKGMLLRKAGYTGAVYREQYEGKMRFCPVAELVLYWGEKPWKGPRSIRQMLGGCKLPPKAWQYIDDLKLHVWEMRRLPQEVRQCFTSDMRIVADYLAEGDLYCSDRPVVHKEALVRMIRVLSGEKDVEDTAGILEEMGIREEDEITVCELFDQYTRKGRAQGLQEGIQQGVQQGIQQGIQQGVQAAISICRQLGVSFEVTAEKIKEQFGMEDSQVQSNMKLYW